MSETKAIRFYNLPVPGMMFITVAVIDWAAFAMVR
jgi:hypothetical protein